MKKHKLFKNKYPFIISFALTGIFFQESVNSTILENGHKEKIDFVWQVVYREFLDPEDDFNKRDWMKLRKKLLSKKYLDTQDAYNSIKEMLASLNDPYTRFMDPSEFNQMKIDLSGELIGVGIQIAKNEKDDLIIISPIEGSPAIEAGLKPQDKIISIDDNPTKGMSIDKAVQLIRGKKGTKVKLEILRKDTILLKSLSRKTIRIKSVSSKINSSKDGYLIGYLRVNKFGEKTSDELKEILIDLEKNNMSGYVLDLRWNPGGSLQSSIDISRHFIDKGTIVSTLTKDGLKDVKKGIGISLTQKPLVVLVNKGSASASEIVSGAIKDNKRGKLVGEKTFGKGLVQNMKPLGDGSAVTLTIAKYLTPNGTDINKFGITPDVKVKMNIKPIRQRDIGTRKDKQYKAGEKELINIIKMKNQISQFNPTTSNLNAFLTINRENKIFSLN